MLDNGEVRASEEQVSQRRKDLFTIVGSIAGMAALLWNFYWTISNARQSYLQLTLDVRVVNSGNATALASIENKGALSKKIDYAALVISPLGMDIREVVAGLRRCNNEASPVNLSAEPAFTVLAFLPRSDVPIYCEGELSILPVTFFYKEQEQIGDEKLSSRILIDVNAFRHAVNPSPAYEVRFVVCGEGRTRATLDLLQR
jgi:hypothetical protein